MESNKVEFIGRIFKTDVKTFSSGTIKTTITICKKNKDDSFDYYDFSFWGDDAEKAGSYKKGNQVCITGRITKNKFTDKNGVNRNELQIVASDIKEVEWDDKNKSYVEKLPF